MLQKIEIDLLIVIDSINNASLTPIHQHKSINP
jgi:hypothetical protein